MRTAAYRGAGRAVEAQQHSHAQHGFHPVHAACIRPSKNKTAESSFTYPVYPRSLRNIAQGKPALDDRFEGGIAPVLVTGR